MIKVTMMSENQRNYPTVMGKKDEVSPKCRLCLHLRRATTNTEEEYYECGKASCMFPECCLWFTDASMIRY